MDAEDPEGAQQHDDQEGGEPDPPRPLPHVRVTPHVAQRWAVERIDALEREGDGSRDEVIKTSLDFGVMINVAVASAWA